MLSMIKVKKSFAYPTKVRNRTVFKTIEAGEYAELPNDALESKKYTRLLELGMIEEFKAEPKKPKKEMPKDGEVKSSKPFKNNEISADELEKIKQNAISSSKDVAKKVGRPKKEV